MQGGREGRRTMALVGCSLLLIVFLSPMALCLADGHGHRDGGKHYEKHARDGKGGGMFGGLLNRGHDKGNEVTGQIVAWSLAAANATVVLSLLLRGVGAFVPLSPELKNGLTELNRSQKKFFMKFHYILNPAILLLAILHWTLSRCSSTALPEWGVVVMGVIVVLGIVLKFKLCPKTFLKNVYKIHTQPVLFLLLLSMIVIGHMAMD